MAAPPIEPPLLNPNGTVLATYQASLVTSVALPFVIYASGGFLLFLLFCWLRRIAPATFAPKRKFLIDPPPPLSDNFFSWLPELLRIPNHAIAKAAGTDALIVVRFMRSSFVFFLLLSFFSIVVILPVNYSGGEVDRLRNTPILVFDNATNSTVEVWINQTNATWSIFGIDELTALRRISIENVAPDSWQSDLHIVFAVLFQILALLNVRAFYGESIGTRVQRVRKDLSECLGTTCGCVEGQKCGPSAAVEGASVPSSPTGAAKRALDVASVPETVGTPSVSSEGSENGTGQSSEGTASATVVDATTPQESPFKPPAYVDDTYRPVPMPLSPTNPRTGATLAVVTGQHNHGQHQTSEQKPNEEGEHTPHVALDLRSVLCMNLPVALRHPYALRQYFEHTLKFGSGEVEAVSVVGLHSELLKALSERYKAVNDVERAWVAWRGNSGERKYTTEGAERVGEVAKMLDQTRKEIESDKLVGVTTTVAGDGKEGIELQEMPPLPPRPFVEPSWWTHMKATIAPGTVSPTELQPHDQLSEAWARFRFHNRRVHLLRKEAIECANMAFDGKCDGPAGAFTEEDGMPANKPSMPGPSSRLTKSEKIAELYTGSTAFVTFKTARSAALAAQLVLPASPGDGLASFLVLPAPHPRDLYWPNLSSRFSTPKLSFIRTLFSIGCLIALVFFWSVPIGMIASFLSVENLTATFPGFAELAQDLPVYVMDAFRAFMPTILVGLWLACLPAVVLVLCVIQGIETYSWIDASTFSKLYFYYVWNLVLVFPIAGSVFNAFKIVVHSPNEIPYLLASTLPGVAPFFINYINLLGFIFLPILVLVPGPVWGPTWFRCCVKYRKKSPRDVQWYTFPVDWMTLNMGQITPLPTLVFTVTLMYSQIQPLVCLAGCAYFFMSFLAHKYFVLYEQVPMAETRGTGYGTVGMAGQLKNRIIFSVILHALIMWGLLVYKGHPDAATVLGVLELFAAFVIYFAMDLTWGKWERKIGLGAAVEHEICKNDESVPLLGSSAFYSEDVLMSPKTMGNRSLTTSVNDGLSRKGTVVARRATTMAGAGSFTAVQTVVDAADQEIPDSALPSPPPGGIPGNLFLEPGYVTGSHDHEDGSDCDSIAAQQPRRGSFFTVAASLAATVLNGGATDGRIPESCLETNVPAPSVKNKDDKLFIAAQMKRANTLTRGKSRRSTSARGVGVDEPIHEQPETELPALSPSSSIMPTIHFQEPAKKDAGYDDEENDEDATDVATDDVEMEVGWADPFVNGLELLPSTSNRFDTYWTPTPEQVKEYGRHWRRYTNFLEPSGTRVLGVLNSVISPLRGQSLFASRVPALDDGSLRTYEHPAVVGRLPWIWLPGVEEVLRVDADEDDLPNPIAVPAVEVAHLDEAAALETKGLEQIQEHALVKTVTFDAENNDLVKRIQESAEESRKAELERERKRAGRPWWLWNSTQAPPEGWTKLVADFDSTINAVGFWGSWFAR